MGNERPMHFGAGTAGNKSLMSYRAGHGISGYAGFCPSNEAIMIPAKQGVAERAGPEASKDRAQPEWKMDTSPQQQSTYQLTINKSATAKPGATHPMTMFTQVPAKDTLLSSQQPSSPLKFVAKSLYGTTFLHPVEQLNKLKQPLPPPTRTRPAYLHGTNYSMTHGNAVEMAYGVGYLDNKPYTPPVSYNEGFKEVTIQPRDVYSSYMVDYGQFGHGVAGRLPDTPEGMIAASTTRELATGTTKQYLRMPGYGGHLPSDTRARHAAAQAFNDHAHVDQKDCRLFTLRQYHLGMPGGMAFIPRDAANLMMEPKGRSGTTSHYANELVARPAVQARLAKKRAEAPTHGNAQETRKFFQGGALMDSENGLANAEMFYRIVRPFEGQPRIMVPSARTVNGYRYDCYTSKVD